jgi:hypothetical protein
VHLGWKLSPILSATVPDLILWYGLLGLNQNGLLGVGDSKIMEVGTIIGDKAYTVQYIADAPRYSDYLLTVQHMVGSLQVTGGAVEDAYSRGYSDAVADAHYEYGHGYDSSCPSGHSEAYCQNYQSGYTTGWRSVTATHS